MIYKYYTCDIVDDSGMNVDTGSMVSRFYIFTSPVKCFNRMRCHLDDVGLNYCKMKNFRRVK